MLWIILVETNIRCERIFFWNTSGAILRHFILRILSRRHAGATVVKCNKRKHCDEIEGNACSKMEDIHHDTDNKLHCFHAGVYGAPLTVVNIQRRSEAAHIQVAKQ